MHQHKNSTNLTPVPNAHDDRDGGIGDDNGEDGGDGGDDGDDNVICILMN